MDKRKKGLWTSTLVFTVFAVVLSLVGSVMMFCDKDVKWGIMPFFGFLFALVALILLIVAKKKNKVAIGTIVLSIISKMLLNLSNIVINGDTYNNVLYGYGICFVAGMLLFVVYILTIAFVSVEKYVPMANSGTSKIEMLKGYKELLDMGAITQQEYDAKKRQIIG